MRAKAPASVATDDYPFVLNTGRVRDHWHTMTRTGLSARLSSHFAEPYLDIHPNDARDLNLEAADLAEVKRVDGSAILRVRVTDAVVPGQVFAPIHWTGETAPTGRIDAVVAAHVDPVSGQPESKASVVSVNKMTATWYGFAVSARQMQLSSDYWALAATITGYRAELAGYEPITDWEKTSRDLFGLPDSQMSLVADSTRGTARVAFEENGQLIAALFVSPRPVAVMRDYLTTLPGDAAQDVLTGRSPADRPDPGPTLCSCFGVGVNTIVAAIESQGLMNVDAIGAALQAGTNCGSCRPELAALLQAQTKLEAAE